jgi:quercetin dioxygenase-like cupin family protein
MTMSSWPSHCAREIPERLQPASAGRPQRLETRSSLLLAVTAVIASTLISVSTVMAQEAITPLISNDLANFAGREVLTYTVEFPPGFSSPAHRHNAVVAVYVLEGSIVMQVKGGDELTLTPGQTFHENPDDIHVVSRNASRTKSAKFLVFMIKHKAAPLLVLEK